MSPETQRRIDRLPLKPLPWVRHKSAVTPGEPHRQPSTERRTHRALVLSEALFKEVLVRERRRMERSDRSFAVLMVSIDDRLGEDPLVVWGSVVDALHAAKRETDTIGWIQRGLVLGVVLTEIESSDAALVSDIRTRLRGELLKRLPERTVAAILIRLHAHPDLRKPCDAAGATLDPLMRALQPRDRRGETYRVIKRVLDVAGGLSLLALLSPVFLVIALLIKLTSRGPVFFKQVRIGERARPFRMLKFRTMFTDSDPALHQEFVTRFITSSDRCNEPGKDARFKIAHDPRITPLGRFLRTTSLDELPQFWNVVRGEMSLVGPRPPLSYEVDVYQGWHRRRVLDAKPGITGLWQVKGRSRTTFDDMVRLDLQYARNQSLWADIKILVATPAAVMHGKGAR